MSRHSVILVADGPGPSGEGPWRELEARCEVTGFAARRLTLMGFWAGKPPPLSALEAAGGMLADALKPGDLVVAVGAHVARAMHVDADILALQPGLGAGAAAWIPPPRSPWWDNPANRQRARYWLLRWCGLDPDAETRTTPLIDFPSEPQEHPRAMAKTLLELHTAKSALSAACAVTGAKRGIVAAGHGRGPSSKIDTSRCLAAWLARVEGGCRDSIIAHVLGTAVATVSVMVRRFQAQLMNPSVVRLSVQGSLAFELIEDLRLCRKLPELEVEVAA